MMGAPEDNRTGLLTPLGYCGFITVRWPWEPAGASASAIIEWCISLLMRSPNCYSGTDRRSSFGHHHHCTPCKMLASTIVSVRGSGTLIRPPMSPSAQEQDRKGHVGSDMGNEIVTAFHRKNRKRDQSENEVPKSKPEKVSVDDSPKIVIVP